MLTPKSCIRTTILREMLLLCSNAQDPRPITDYAYGFHGVHNEIPLAASGKYLKTVTETIGKLVDKIDWDAQPIRQPPNRAGFSSL